MWRGRKRTCSLHAGELFVDPTSTPDKTNGTRQVTMVRDEYHGSPNPDRRNLLHLAGDEAVPFRRCSLQRCAPPGSDAELIDIEGEIQLELVNWLLNNRRCTVSPVIIRGRHIRLTRIFNPGFLRIPSRVHIQNQNRCSCWLKIELLVVERR